MSDLSDRLEKDYAPAWRPERRGSSCGWPRRRGSAPGRRRQARVGDAAGAGAGT